MSKFLSLESGRGMWNATDQHGNTPVMMAAKYASRDVITLLLHNEEISLEAVDNLGQDTVISWVRRRDLHILTIATITYTADRRYNFNQRKSSDAQI